MAARVGLLLPHALLVSSARALPTPRARLPYPPPPIPTYRRRASSASRPRRASPRLLAVRAMASGNPYAAELAAAKKAVTLAARLCKTVQQDIVHSGVQAKADKSPVTVADYGSQILVSLALKMDVASGPFSLVAEEDSEELRKEGAEEILEDITDLVNETIVDDGSYNISFTKEGILSAIDDGKSEGGPSGRHWVLDPIDGTKGFLRGDQYAIALALLDDGKVVLGVLACPNLPLSSINNLNGNSSGDQVGALFSATIGCGAEVESLYGSPPQKKLGVQAPPVRIDSQAKYGALARGDGAIYLRFPHKGYREKIWDHAAGSIVVTEAGGIVTDAAGNDLDFSKGRFLDLDTGIIATNKNLMPSLLKAVQEAIKEMNQATSLL
ncbi:3'(2'),5'-bisphosphate nucleotidase isoform X2 [Miscanthus floridulus]|uniref:3'(2'),5'-bisphosphate nucleotidase isoform X2 n=1 Tax=Miscanthus floridulus TaxID=154761 RepID=UPI00345B157C